MTEVDSFDMPGGCSIVGGCELCVQSHELVVLQAGLTDDQVHDAVRVAATVNGVATARAIQA